MTDDDYAWNRIDDLFDAASEKCTPDLIGKRISLSLESGDVSRIFTSREMLVAAMSNLIENGILNSPTGSNIVVRAELDAVNETMRFSIVDEGSGVDMNEMLRYQRGEISLRSPRKGIGTYLTTLLCEMLGGSLSYKHNSPHGTVACITLPCRDEPFLPTDYSSYINQEETRSDEHEPPAESLNR